MQASVLVSHAIVANCDFRPQEVEDMNVSSTGLISASSKLPRLALHLVTVWSYECLETRIQCRHRRRVLDNESVFPQRIYLDSA